MKNRNRILKVDELISNNKFKQDIKSTDDIMFEMSNYRTRTTGLPMIIWVSSKGNAKHGPRIKVQSNYSQKVMPDELFVVTVAHSPILIEGKQGDITNDDVNQVYKWVIKNYNILWKLWKYEITTDDFSDQIQKV